MPIPHWIPILGRLDARKRMKRDLPALMARWGLSFLESEERRLWGRFQGTVEGHAVTVEPEGPSLLVALDRDVDDFHLSTFDVGRKRRDHGLGHPRFEKAFPWIELEPLAAGRLHDRADLLDRLLALRRGPVAVVTVSQSGLHCVLHYPFDLEKGPHYVETADVERLLPEMIAVVRLVEEVLAGDAGAGTGR